MLRLRDIVCAVCVCALRKEAAMLRRYALASDRHPKLELCQQRSPVSRASRTRRVPFLPRPCNIGQSPQLMIEGIAFADFCQKSLSLTGKQAL